MAVQLRCQLLWQSTMSWNAHAKTIMSQRYPWLYAGKHVRKCWREHRQV